MCQKNQNHKDKIHFSLSRVLHSKEFSYKIIRDIFLGNDSITEDQLTVFKQVLEMLLCACHIIIRILRMPWSFWHKEQTEHDLLLDSQFTIYPMRCDSRKYSAFLQLIPYQ